MFVSETPSDTLMGRRWLQLLLLSFPLVDEDVDGWGCRGSGSIVLVPLSKVQFSIRLAFMITACLPMYDVVHVLVRTRHA